jgi:uncharacterized membrane protein
MFWGLLFGLLFFVPVFGMAIGAGLGTLMGKVEKSGIDREFQAQVRDLLQPGTSALFLVVERVTPDKAVEALSKSAAPCSSRPCRKAPRRSCKRSFTVPKSLSPSRSNGAKQIL